MAKKMTALITGSYGGLGTCFVKLHAQAGGDLILVGRSQAKLDEQKAEVEKTYGVHADTIAADLSSAEDVEKVYTTCKENGWEVDYLINNAGFGGHGDFARERTMEQDMSIATMDSRRLAWMPMTKRKEKNPEFRIIQSHPGCNWVHWVHDGINVG